MRSLPSLVRHAAAVGAALCLLWLPGCASGPPHGWVQSDAAGGTYVWLDGRRYVGARAGDKFQGVGTLSYPKEQGAYKSARWPGQLAGMTLRGRFADDHIVGDKVQATGYDRTGKTPVFVYEGGWNAGTTGKGVVTFPDGRRYEGSFSTRNSAFVYFTDNASFGWDTSSTLGSKFSGEGRMTWPDGSEFIGYAHDYYLFDQGGVSAGCLGSIFFGRGVLHRPGHDDYVGFVRDDDGVAKPTRREDFEQYVGFQYECDAKVAAERSRSTLAKAEYDASMAKARRDASAMLARDLSALPARMATQMAEVSAASRGTTPQAEQAKAERDAAFHASLAESESDPGSELNRARRTREREQAAETARRAEAARKAEASRQGRRDQERTAGTSNASDPAQDEVRRADEKKRQEEQLQREQKERDARRLAAENEKRELIATAERHRREADEKARLKAEEERRQRDTEMAQALYLSKMQGSIHLKARSCPGGEGKHYVVGLRPRIKPEPVSCIDVHYDATCPGDRVGTSGVAKNFVGMGTDCFTGDAAAIPETPMCRPAEVRLTVTRVSACG